MASNNPFADLIPQNSNAPAAAQQQQGNNPFGDLIPQQGAAAQQQSPDGGFMGKVNAFAEGFNRQFGRLAEGVLQVGGQAAQAVGVPGAETFNKKLQAYNQQQEQSLAQTSEEFPVSTTLGQVTGAVGTAVPFGAAGAGRALGSQVLSNAGAGALMGVAEYGTPEERATRGAIGGAIGAAVPLAAAAVSRPVKGILGDTAKKVLQPEAAVTDDVLNALQTSGDDLGTVIQRGQAAQAQGVPLTIGEQSNNPLIKSMEARIPLTPENQAAVQQFTAQRTKSVAKATKSLIDDMVPEGDEVAQAAKSQMYSSLGDINLNDEALNVVKENPVIADALDKLNTSTLVTKDVKELADSNILKLDKVKQIIDDQLYTNKSVVANTERNLLPEERLALKQAKGELVNMLDSASGGKYAAARKLSERTILKQKLLDDIASIKAQPGVKSTDEIYGKTIDQVYDKLFSTGIKQENFLDAVASSGGNAQNASNLIETINDIRKTPLAKLVTKDIGAEGRQFSNTMTGEIRRFAEKLLEGRYNKAFLDLTLSGPKWQGELSNALAAQTQPDKLYGLSQIFNRAAKLGLTRIATPGPSENNNTQQ